MIPTMRDMQALIGTRFGMRVVTGHGGKRGHVAFRCDCGREGSCQFGNIKSTRSCGCNKSSSVAAARRKHGHTSHNGAKGRQHVSTEYNAWTSAKARCYNKNNPKYESYGGRGIYMAEEWRNDFAAFLAYIGPKPEPKRDYSVDRINNDGPYAPGNVQWATQAQQRINQRERKR